jgi:phospholipase/carboxylesterase
MKRIIALIVICFMNLYSLKASVLEYVVRKPKIKIEKPPVILLLHGVGSNEQDLFSFADQLPDKFLVISARAPFTLASGSYAWYQVDFSSGKPVINNVQEQKSREVLIQFISELKKEFRFDEKQVYLGGFSQGAIMAYSVGLTRPDLVHGIFAMSGRLLEEVKPFIAAAENLGKLRVFISHGINDGTLGIHYARESTEFLNGLKINTTFKDYPEGHNISHAMLKDLIHWLNDNVK